MIKIVSKVETEAIERKSKKEQGSEAQKDYVSGEEQVDSQAVLVESVSGENQKTGAARDYSTLAQTED